MKFNIKNTVLTQEQIEELSSSQTTPRIQIENKDALEYLETIPNNSIDLILTDPPYIISKKGARKLLKRIKPIYNPIDDMIMNEIEKKTIDSLVDLGTTPSFESA